MSFLATRMSAIKPSPTFAIMGAAQKRKNAGESIIILAAGEPDFDTPDAIKAMGKEAIDKGFTKYTAVDGIPALKNAIQKKLLEDNGLSYNVSEIMISTGGKQVIFNALMATLNEGDEVVIPAPYWVSYVDIVKLFGGVPVILECTEDNAFKLTSDQLKKALTARTKWFILNSPSNPTGSIYTRKELEALANVLLSHDCLIMSDDIYEYITYDDEIFVNIPMVAPALLARTLIVNGVSKSYAMTGWRLGYGAGPEALIKAMTTLQSQSTSNACSISQHAALAALTGPRDFLKNWKKSFAERRDFCLEHISTIPRLTCITPKGAFYLYVGCSELLGKRTPSGATLESDHDVATYFLDHVGVAVVPGGAFGMSPFIRISYATSLEELREACIRMKNAVEILGYA